jgi:predicted RNase H-like nuclease (RuvC/YqgF family)
MPTEEEDAQHKKNAAHAFAVIRENNALRRINERLTTENERLRQELEAARKSASTAQMMAQHWRIQATGKTEDQPTP